jgi:hypothetical protein
MKMDFVCVSFPLTIRIAVALIVSFVRNNSTSKAFNPAALVQTDEGRKVVSQLQVELQVDWRKMLIQIRRDSGDTFGIAWPGTDAYLGGTIKHSE